MGFTSQVGFLVGDCALHECTTLLQSEVISDMMDLTQPIQSLNTWARLDLKRQTGVFVYLHQTNQMKHRWEGG